MRTCTRIIVSAALAWGIAAALPVAAGASEERPVNPDILTAAEVALAAQVAEESPEVAVYLASLQPVYRVRVELLRLKEDEARRFALVTHYRYEGDLTIQSAVDLEALTVFEVTATPALPAPLAAEELDRARQLALAHPEVRAGLGPHLPPLESGAPGYAIQSLALHSTDPEDPIHGHRVLGVLFETPDGYIVGLDVLVDLSTGAVSVEPREVMP
jgi:hypothetical protein